MKYIVIINLVRDKEFNLLIINCSYLFNNIDVSYILKNVQIIIHCNL